MSFDGYSTQFSKPPVAAMRPDARRRSPLGHEEKLSPLTLSARYVIRQETFAGTHGNGRDAPSAVIPTLAPNEEVRPI
jgi:hypothetical protein